MSIIYLRTKICTIHKLCILFFSTLDCVCRLIVSVSCEGYENPMVLGSLSMYPPSDDNYGIDSCSIMCLQTTPPIVVIAMCSGKIYHAILLREILDDEEDDRKV